MSQKDDLEAKRAYRRKYDLERYHRRRKEAIAYLGGKCSSCGTTDDLEIDHIVPKKKSFTLSSKWGIAKEKFWAEVKKCQLLCNTCHKEKNKTDNGEAKHGTCSMYHYRKCRCDACKAAQSVYMKEYNRRIKLS